MARKGVDGLGHRRWWEIDHKTPLWAGGANHVDNLQVLCVPCHREKTAREAAERAKQRRNPGQTELELEATV
ncbi:MAG: hypothetical protein GF320_11380 [Armatimonadia bacterium]|nr:hypothetical protein [Armatimonadia bacterium]